MTTPERPSVHEDLERIVDENVESLFSVGEREKIVKAIGEYIARNFVRIELATDTAVESRLNETELMLAVAQEISDARQLDEGYDDADAVLLRFLEHIQERRQVIKGIAARKEGDD